MKVGPVLKLEVARDLTNLGPLLPGADIASCLTWANSGGQQATQ